MKLGKLLVGMGLGAVLGTLLAPKKGSETYEDLKEFATKQYNNLKDLTKDDIEAKIGESIDQLKKAVDEFDSDEFKAYSQDKLEELTELLNEYADKIKNSDEYHLIKENVVKAYEVLKVKINDLLEYLKSNGIDVKEVEKEINNVEEEIEEVINDDK